MSTLIDFSDLTERSAERQLAEFNSESYSVKQAIQYLKLKFPKKKFDESVISSLVRQGKLEPVVSFIEEVHLAEAWLKSEHQINDAPCFAGDYGFLYNINTPISFKNSLIAYKVKVPFCDETLMQNIMSEICRVIEGKREHEEDDPRANTKYDVLLFRDNKYWKVIDVYFDEEGNKKFKWAKCFFDSATWGISTDSLQQYHTNPTQEEIDQWKDLYHNERWTYKKFVKTLELQISKSAFYRLVGKRQPKTPIRQIVAWKRKN
ncbi:MAG: hypothetical protein LWW76_05940 [Burkholderiales bacterium]|nr:hypothetical protein [Burkholderiales bacterium]